MKINLSKIEKFYRNPIGSYAYNKLADIFEKLLEGPAKNQGTCIASSGAFPYIGLLSDMKRLSLQAFHHQSQWPDLGRDNYLIADSTHWPYRAEEADFVVIIHDLEFAEDPELYLREAWRVLKGEGQLIIAFPNRSGKWARFDNTPFGLGYPYTLEQMRKLLGSAHFAIDEIEKCLFYRPIEPQSLFGRLSRKIIDAFGRYCLYQPGVYVICASKHIYAPVKGAGATAKVAEKAKQALFPKPTAGVNKSN